jgi:hypothetical protein
MFITAHPVLFTAVVLIWLIILIIITSTPPRDRKKRKTYTKITKSDTEKLFRQGIKEVKKASREGYDSEVEIKIDFRK